MAIAVEVTIGGTLTLSLANNTFTPLTFNVVYNDPWGMADLGVHNDRLTIPVAGIWLLKAAAIFAANATGARQIQIVRNGVTAIEFVNKGATSAGDNTWIEAIALTPLAAGDVITAQVYQGSGSLLSTVASATLAPLLQAALLGS